MQIIGGLHHTSQQYKWRCTCILWYLGIRLDLKVVVTEVALHPKLENGSGVVIPHFALLCIVAHSHAHM